MPRWARVAFATALLAAAGCASSPPALTSDGADSGGLVDASPASPGPCFLCVDAGDPYEVDASLAVRVRRRLEGCNGMEGCHVSAAANLTFPIGDETRALIGVRSTERPDLLRVAPDDPEASYLYLKVRGDGGIEGSTMPLGATFDPRLPSLVLAWIEAGAP